MSRSMKRATRLQRIEELLLSAPDGYSIQELADKLGVHRTTIWRDINELSSSAPIQEHNKRYFIDRENYVSSVKLTRGESLMLYLAMRRMMRRAHELPPMLALALEKLSHALRDPTSKQFAKQIETIQSKRGLDPESALVWERLIQAWIERITIRITYQEHGRSVLDEYEIQPYLFEPGILSEGVFIVAYSLTHKAMKTFRVERILKAILTTERFVRPEGIVADTLLRRLWGTWYGETLSEVILRFRDPAVARRVRRTVWLPSQELHNLSDGGVEWSAKVSDVFELVPWIRSWGPECEVISPPELQEYIQKAKRELGDVIMAMNEVPHKATFTSEFLNTLYGLKEGERVKTCIQCGACSGVCPFGYVMDSPTRRMIAALRADTFETVMDTDTVWMCVSCAACSEVCPAKIPLADGLMTRTKEEKLLKGDLPTELQEALERSQRYGNPLGESPRRRADWAKKITPEVRIMAKAKVPVDFLWFVGDYASYHPRVQKATVAFARILNTLGVDFGILGPEESSDGDTQRLAGERGLFEMLAEKNDRAFRKYTFGEIITTDPHAYNAIKNEYPALGITYPVRHYIQFLAERIEQLKPHLTEEVDAIATFHDPCYLGRVNGIFDEPRQILEVIPGVEITEMAHSREASLCCGGGGGGMWLDGFQWEKAHVRLSEWRVREAMKASGQRETFLPPGMPKTRKRRKKASKETRQRVLVTACPYEPPRFEDAVKTIDEASDLIVKDIAELLAQSMGLEG